MPQRPKLDSFDNAQALTAERMPYNLVTVLALEGPVDAERLRAGLARLARRHPMLRTRVVEAGGRRFEPVDGALDIPLEVATRRDAESWIGVTESELVRRVDLGQLPLVRCVLVAADGDNASEIVLAVPHVLVDGTAMTHVAGELVRFLAGEEAAGLEQEPAAIPAGAEARFPAGWRWPRRLPGSTLFLARQLGGELAFRWQTRGRLPHPPSGEPRCRVLPWSLTEAETERLSRAARQARVTVTAALEAAMLLAVVRHRYPGAAMPHRYFTFPLLRRYLEPAVADDVVRCYVTLLRLTARVAPSDALWELAATISRDIDLAMRRGERFLASLWSHFSMRMVFAQRRARMATTALSYTGAVRQATRVGALEVVRIHAFVSNFPLGPEYTAQARYFRGRLWLDVVYLDNDMTGSQAEAIAASMRALLTGATLTGADWGDGAEAPA